MRGSLVLINFVMLSLSCQTIETIAQLVGTPTPTETTVPTPTSTTRPTAIPTPYCPDAVTLIQATTSNGDKLIGWIKHTPWSDNTPLTKPTALTSALNEMRAMRTNYANITAPDCAQQVKRAFLAWIDALIDEYSDYQKTKDELRFLSKHADVLEKSDKAIEALKSFGTSAGAFPTATPAPIPGGTVKLLAWTWYRTQSGNYIYVDGQVQNISDRPIRFVRINITLLDRNKSLLSTDSGYIDLTTLQPGQVSNFKIMTQYRTGTDSVSITNIEWKY